MSTAVKFLHSGMAGAPGMSTAADSVIGVLDAVLVNGFNERTATGISVSGGVATVTLPSGHGFEVDSVVLVSGATPSALNGEKRVLTTAATTITFDATGVSDGAASGTVLVRYAPLGWTKAFTGTNAAAYRSTDVTSTQMFLNIPSDTAAASTAVISYESMTSATVGTGPFPASGNRFWAKGNSVSVSSPWLVVGDGKTFYLLKQQIQGTTFNSGSVFGFGDFVSFSALDPYRCFVSVALTTTMTGTSVPTSNFEGCVEVSGVGNTSTGCAAPRSRSGVAGAVSLQKLLESYQATATNNVVSGGSTNPGGTAFATYPAPANHGLILSRVILAEGGGPRGYLRGLFHTPQNCHTAFNQMDRVQGQGQFAGRKLMALKCGSPAGTTSQGVVFVDITGPWES